MERMIVKFADDAGAAVCACCGESTRWTKGPRLVLAERGSAMGGSAMGGNGVCGGGAVCRGCGKRHAAELMALLDLAHVADRVGRQYRRLLTPPMEALLDLARAAENYSTCAPKRRVRAV